LGVLDSGGNSTEMVVNNILLTGRPGVGKTTVITRLAELLKDRAIAGFYTQEIRTSGQRQGFGVTTFAGRSGVLAHVNLSGAHRVGRYRVDVATFEELVLPELARPCDVTLVDEIGKMECFSARFIDALRGVLNRATPVVSTIAISGGGFIAEVKRRPDAEVLQVKHRNREELPQQLAERVRATSGG
jgi:nucleoside-triphosphatase